MLGSHCAICQLSNHNKEWFDSDVAILKLSSPLMYNAHVGPACLPPNQAFYPEDNGENNAYISGWGLLQDSNETIL